MEVLDIKDWAQKFSETDVDCTISVVLKILDGKCKMSQEQWPAVLTLYDIVRDLPGKLFLPEDHENIARARNGEVLERIHELRVYAESKIPKPVMKAYKTKLREALKL